MHNKFYHIFFFIITSLLLNHHLHYFYYTPIIIYYYYLNNCEKRNYGKICCVIRRIFVTASGIHNTHHPWSWTPLVFSVLDLIWGIGVKGSPLYLYYAKAEYKPELSVLILSSQSHFMLPI